MKYSGVKFRAGHCAAPDATGAAGAAGRSSRTCATMPGTGRRRGRTRAHRHHRSGPRHRGRERAAAEGARRSSRSTSSACAGSLRACRSGLRRGPRSSTCPPARGTAGARAWPRSRRSWRRTSTGSRGFVADQGIDPVRACDLSRKAVSCRTRGSIDAMIARGRRMNAVGPAAISSRIPGDFITGLPGPRLAHGRPGRPPRHGREGRPGGGLPRKP